MSNEQPNLNKRSWEQAFKGLKLLAIMPESSGKSFIVRFQTLPELIQFLNMLKNNDYLIKKDAEELPELLDHENWHSLFAEKYDIHDGFGVSFSIVDGKVYVNSASVSFDKNKSNSVDPLDVVETALASHRGKHILSRGDFGVIYEYLSKSGDSIRKGVLLKEIDEAIQRYINIQP